MNITIGCAVLSYDELPKDYQVRLLHEEYESLGEIWQCDHLADEFKERLEAIGFMEPKIWYSGFGDQGDGACFDASVDIEKVFKHLGVACEDRDDGLSTMWTCEILIINHRYSHEKTRKIELNNVDITYIDVDVILELEEKIEALRLELCNGFYRVLSTDYYNETSEERCLEELRSRSFVMRRALQETLAEATGCEFVEVI